MVVVNTSGIPFALMYKGQRAVIPFDNRTYTIPDDFGFHKQLKVLVPPAPIPVKKEEVLVVDDLEKAKVNEKLNKPLKGRKAKKRDKILKENKGKKYYQRMIEG
jgi:hypothetical protein